MTLVIQTQFYFGIIAGITFSAVLWVFWRKKIIGMLKINDEEMNLSASKNFNKLSQTIEELLKKRKEELKKMHLLENYRKDYIGNVAHELKTPVFAVQGFLESILDDDTMDKKTKAQFLQKALNNIERIGSIINDLDVIVKYESGNLILNKEVFDFIDVYNIAQENSQRNADLLNITISLRNTSSSTIVFADKNRITQVLMNLLINAIKYGKQHGYVEVKLHSNGEQLIVEVADNGMGISSTDLPRIFERFYRVEKSRTRDKGGSGLGLSICKHIIDAHNSEISVYSTEGVGSIFMFFLDHANLV